MPIGLPILTFVMLWVNNNLIYIPKEWLSVMSFGLLLDTDSVSESVWSLVGAAGENGRSKCGVSNVAGELSGKEKYKII